MDLRVAERPDTLNPCDLEEFAEANAIHQREMWLWKAAPVIAESTDLLFLNRCLSLSTRAAYKYWNLGFVLADLAQKRIEELHASLKRRLRCRLRGHQWHMLASVVQPDENMKPNLHTVKACGHCFAYDHKYSPYVGSSECT